MRTLHAPLFFAIEGALRDVFGNGYLADKVIQRHFQANRKWGSHDRRLFAEAVYEIVRWWRRLLIATGSPKPDAYVPVIVAWCQLNEVHLPPRLEVPRFDVGDLKPRWQAAGAGTRAERESLPDALDAVIAAQLGARWDTLLTILNGHAPVYLRANRLLTTPAKLIEQLAREKIEAHPVREDALVLNKRVNVHQTEAFRRGWFEVQDLNSQRVAKWVAPEPGERVIDACAGGGGKSLHLAARMKNKGRIIAMDVVERKLEELRRRAKRSTASCIETKLIEGTKTIKRQRETADRVLLDVPCTGLGVWRRNPDAKWRLTAETIARVNQLQRDILGAYPQMVKVGGRLVYSTCSILPEENERQLERFLSQNGASWELERAETLYPEAGGADGFYLAALKRTR